MKNLLLIAIIASVPLSASAATIYVDANATGANDGSSWTNAYNFLQDALADARSHPYINQIYVAQGIYTPDTSTADPKGTGERLASFALINGVAFYGGFPSGGSDTQHRDPSIYETILSGDIGILGDNSDNCYHIFHHPEGLNLNSSAVLDGFTVTAGNANGPYPHYTQGGGMDNYYCNPTIINCLFSYNGAHYYGGGMYNVGSEPNIINCTFSENSADHGGGMSNAGSNPHVVSCTFNSNHAWVGGGISNERFDNPNISKCIFRNNSAGHSGGGLSTQGGGDPSITDCIFIGNTARTAGGAMFNGGANGGGEAIVINCTFANNSATYGGGMYSSHGCKPNITNCIFWNNSASRADGEISEDKYSLTTVIYSNIQGGWLGPGNIDVDPCFAAPGYWDPNGTPDDANDDFWVDGDYHLLPDSPCINSGDPNYAPEPNETDLDGNPRIINDRIDMGAYEYQPSPAELLLALSDHIDQLNLPAGTASSLKAKLDAAIKKLNDNNGQNDKAAANALKAFINAVEAQQGKKIPTADADGLITAAQDIIELINNN
jgi:predicted outer membrane repeat protein